ncbi:MAG: hypothetical protein M1833_006785 [Piccolia ochrophora]|nr:MAG: hypothetical protein M1833_006785 [Piccolia ochrophora]
MAPRQNRYFLPGEGIRREVITADICRYLGNDALVKPGQYEGREGYWVTAYRALTSDMIADLKADSMRWQAETMEADPRGGASVPYRDSRTHEYRQYYGPTQAQQQQQQQHGQSHQGAQVAGNSQGDPRSAPPAGYDQYYSPQSQGYPGMYAQGGYPPQQDVQGHHSNYSFQPGAPYSAQSHPRSQQYPPGTPQYPPGSEQVYQQPGAAQPPGVPRGGPQTQQHPRDPYGRGGYN